MKLAVLLCMIPGVLIPASGSSASAARADAQKDLVVLLHGIGHAPWNMYGLERRLRREGYAVLNLGYPSLRNDLGALAAWLDARLRLAGAWDRPDGGRVHFVTHSMGGLVTRRYLEAFRAHIPPEKMGRVVMIAPPNGGSEVADLLKNFPPYKWAFGPAGQELTTAARAGDITVPWYETGIIAGTKSWPYPEARFLFGGPNDGRVSVDSAKLPGMTDFIAVPATHSFIAWRADVGKMVISYLECGKFIEVQDPA